MYKEELKRIIKKFLKETEEDRTIYVPEHDVPLLREPTFDDFMEWILGK